MLASGPPDGLFDDSATTSTSGDFESIMRFGSQGPTIYDYVLISIPYTQGSSSTTGLNESATVNVSIPNLYDSDWNVIWNTANNGTDGSNLAGNQSHYSTYSSQWQTLMGNNTCYTDATSINSTHPCYIDKTNNRIWIRLPHFSGTGPKIAGSLITATPSSSSSSSGGGGTGTVNEWSKQKVTAWTKITPGNVTIMKDFDKEIGLKEIQIEVNNPTQNVKITVRKYNNKPANVSVEKTGKVYKYLQILEENLVGKLKKATIKIRVEKKWLSDNNLARDKVALFKFNENLGQWDELTTNYVEEDSDNYYYNAEVTSFSYFAIGEKILPEQHDRPGGPIRQRFSPFQAQARAYSGTGPNSRPLNTAGRFHAPRRLCLRFPRGNDRGLPALPPPDGKDDRRIWRQDPRPHLSAAARNATFPRASFPVRRRDEK
jgi:PGF-pre-PGF domain-containing protein